MRISDWSSDVCSSDLETDDEDALTLLRHPRLGADHPCLDMIFQFVAEHIHDGREGPSAIMAFKILDIFKDERRRSMMGDDLGRVEEKRALRIAQESVGSTERIFLGHPGDRKRLTGEPGPYSVMPGAL